MCEAHNSVEHAPELIKHFRLPTDFPKLRPIPKELACKGIGDWGLGDWGRIGVRS